MAFLLDALHEDDGVALYDQRRGDSWDPIDPIRDTESGVSRMLQQGLVNVPFWEYWTSPYSSHQKDHIPIMVGYVKNGDI